MKKLYAVFFALLLTAGLTACGGGAGSQPAEFDTALADQLLSCGAFSEELESLDADVLWMLYGLEDAGLKREQLLDGRAYRSAGATCEEVAVLRLSDEEAAKLAQAALEAYVDDQIRSNEDYRPAEIPKLQNADIQCRGATLLLMVANDPDAAAELLK